MHKTPWLWRLHRIHHSDARLDVSTAVRDHPLEIAALVITLGLSAAAFGMNVWAVIVYEVAELVISLASHANLRLPDRLDRRCAGSSSRRTCTVCIIPHTSRKPTATTGSCFRSGTTYSALLGRPTGELRLHPVRLGGNSGRAGGRLLVATPFADLPIAATIKTCRNLHKAKRPGRAWPLPKTSESKNQIVPFIHCTSFAFGAAPI